MSLAEWTPITEEVKLGNTSFHVAGLCADDISSLMHVHGPMIEDIAVEIALLQKQKKLSPLAAVQIVMDRFPTIAAHVVQLASGERHVPIETIAKIPAPVMIDALTRVIKLTFEDVGGPKELAEMLQSRLGDKAKASLENLKTVIRSRFNTSEESEKMSASSTSTGTSSHTATR